MSTFEKFRLVQNYTKHTELIDFRIKTLNKENGIDNKKEMNTKYYDNDGQESEEICERMMS